MAASLQNAVVEPAPVLPIYLQVLGLGLPWTLAHCAAMCGPIVLGLRFGARVGRPATASNALADLAAYQAGRLVFYTAAGAAVGAAGSLIAGWRWGLVALSIGAAVIFLVAAARHLPYIARRLGPSAATPGPLARRLGSLAHWRERHPLSGAALIGALLAGLPCGISAWALALAAATAAPWHGAAVMALIVAMSSLPLGAAVLAPVAGRRFGLRGAPWLVPVCLLLSAGLTLTMAIGQARAEPACPMCAVPHG
jgi:sulfite exporter TauE/SafE